MTVDAIAKRVIQNQDLLLLPDSPQYGQITLGVDDIIILLFLISLPRFLGFLSKVLLTLKAVGKSDSRDSHHG